MDVNTPEIKVEEPKLEETVIPEQVVQDEPRTVSFADYEQLKRTNDRLLEESKRNKLMKQRAEEAKLQAEGKKEEVIDSLRNRLSSYEEKEQENAIAGALAMEAKKRGCEHWDLLYNSTGGEGVNFDPDTGAVLGVDTFFDNAEADDRLRQVYFTKPQAVVPDTSTPSMAGANNASYTKDPLGYLEKIKAERGIEEYQKVVQKMIRDGIIQ